MSEYWYCIASKLIAATGFVTLVIFDHPWLGLICLLLAATDPKGNWND